MALAGRTGVSGPITCLDASDPEIEISTNNFE